jgi:glycosyltransferase involved in cell wall biosynthesis
MRVAYICADPGVPVFGCKGCSVHVQEVIRALAQQGARVDLFTTRAEGERPPGLGAVHLHPLPPPHGPDDASREMAAMSANRQTLDALTRDGPFDLVYERYSLWSYAGMEYARAADVPGLLEVNAPLIDEQAEHRCLVNRELAQRVAARAWSAASVLIAVSDEVCEYLERFAEASGHVEIIANGVDPRRFPRAVSPVRQDGSGKFTIGFVGSLKPWHGLSTLVDAFASVASDMPHTRLLIVGDGPERPRLEGSLAARGLREACFFTGAVPAAEVPGYLADMDVAVAPYPALPSFYFSPLKVLEYMAAGLPVVASRLGQITKLISQEINGLLCPPGDSVALARALCRLREDPALRQRLGKAAREAVLTKHTWDAVAKRILRLAEEQRASRFADVMRS